MAYSKLQFQKKSLFNVDLKIQFSREEKREKVTPFTSIYPSEHPWTGEKLDVPGFCVLVLNTKRDSLKM